VPDHRVPTGSGENTMRKRATPTGTVITVGQPAAARLP
jgi:hypothetical protein